MNNLIKEKTDELIGEQNKYVWFLLNCTNLANFVHPKYNDPIPYVTDINGKKQRITTLFKNEVFQYFRSKLKIKCLRELMQDIRFPITNDWYDELLNSGVYPSNIGVIVEPLCNEKNANLLKKSWNKFRTIHKLLKDTTSYKFSKFMTNNYKKFKKEIKTILKNKKIYKYFDEYRKEIENHFGIPMQTRRGFAKITEHYIAGFEFDFITDKQVLCDVKISKKEFDPEWFYQLLLYALGVKKYMNIHIKTIAILNPKLSMCMYANIDEMLDYDEWLKWCDENYIL